MEFLDILLLCESCLFRNRFNMCYKNTQGQENRK